MSTKNFISCLLITSTFLFCNLSKAQTLDFNTNQQLTISSPGFFPFSTTSNDIFKEVLPTNNSLTVQFSNFLGGPCAVAPAADFGEIGPQTVINGNGEFVLDFSNQPINPNLFGLSLVPQSGPCIFDLFIQPPGGTSSTSGGIITEPPPSDDTITPNGLTIFGGFLSDSLTSQISNENNNPQCGNSPFGIDQSVINGSNGNNFFNLTANELGLNLKNRTLNKAFKDEPETFTVAIPE